MATKNPEIHTDEIALFSRPPVNVAEVEFLGMKSDHHI